MKPERLNWTESGKKFCGLPIELQDQTAPWNNGGWLSRIVITDDTEITSGPHPTQEEAIDGLRTDLSFADEEQDTLTFLKSALSRRRHSNARRFALCLIGEQEPPSASTRTRTATSSPWTATATRSPLGNRAPISETTFDFFS